MTPQPLLIECPECGEVIPVPLSIDNQRVGEDGNWTCDVVPDMADLWSHAWTHTAT